MCASNSHPVRMSSAHRTTIGRTINGKPHPAHLTVEPGKTYYLLPKRWRGETFTTVHVVGRTVVPSQGALMQSSFTVQASAPGAPPPKEFTS